MGEKDKLCSILIAAYNSEDTIEATVESLLKQTYTAIEVIIANDASTDDTRAVVSELVKRDDRVQATHLRNHRGSAEAYNLLIERASGEYIAFVESGDIWFAEKLQRQLALLEKHEADLVYGSYSCINADGAVCETPRIVPEECTLATLLLDNYIHPSTVVMRAEWAQSHRWDDSYTESAYVYWLTLLQAGLLAVGSSEVLIDHRVSAKSTTTKRERMQNRWEVYRSYLGFNPIKASWYLLRSAIASMKRTGSEDRVDQ